MREATLIREDSCPRDVQTEARRFFNETICGTDRMDEPRRNPRVTIDCGPIVGPRGGIRRYTTVIFRDDVCEDGDVEDAIIALLDGPGDEDDERDDEDREENDFDDEEGEDDAPMYAGGMPLDEYVDRIDYHVTVNGEDANVYLAEQEVASVEAATTAETAAHIAARNTHVAKRLEVTRAQASKGWYHQYLVQIVIGRWSSYRPYRMPIAAEVRLMVREGRAPSFEDFLATREYMLRLKEFIVVRVPELWARFSNDFDLAACTRNARETMSTDLGDEDDGFIDPRRTSDSDDEKKRHTPPSNRQRRETLTSRFGGTSVRTEAFDRMADVDPWTVHASLQADEARAFDVVASLIDFDTAAVAWREGQILALQETIDRATTPPAASVTYQPRMWLVEDCAEPRQSDPLDGIWKDDDLEQYERLAMRSARSNSASFFRRMSN